MEDSHQGALDTGAAVERLRTEAYRRMSPAEKLEIVRQLTFAVQHLALARIRRQHPDATEREQKLRLASLWLDEETMLRVFAWDVRSEGY